MIVKPNVLIANAGKLAFAVACLLLVIRGIQVRAEPMGEWPVPPSAKIDFSMRETSRERGLVFKHVPPEIPVKTPWKPYMQTVGMSVAVADVNDDGFMDLYLTNTSFGERNRLYVNDGKGHFTDKAQELGLADVNEGRASLRSFFFDCDSDGRQEAVVMTSACPAFFNRGASGRFEPMGERVPAQACELATAVATADLDADGHLDLILGGLGLDFMRGKVMPGNIVESDDGSPLRVLLNDGQCRFREAPELLGFDKNYFFHSIGVGNFTGEPKSRPDIWVATDYSGDKVFLSESAGYRFETFPGTPSRSGMNSEVVYLDGEGPPSVFVTHVHRRGYITGGNTLWKWDGERFRNRAIDMGLHECGWAWAGRAIDLDHDGLLDLAVANGFISGDPKRDYWYPFGVMHGTASPMMTDPSYWVDMNGRDLSGHQRDCLYVNRGDRFENVAAAVGFDEERQDGRAVAVIDADNDGRQSLVIGNQKGELRFYDIEPKKPNSWVGFDLRSRKANREALGAVVTVRAGGKSYRREKFTLNSYESQSDPRLHFGLGPVEKIDSVQIRWPSGAVQELGALPLNTYHAVVEE